MKTIDNHFSKSTEQEDRIVPIESKRQSKESLSKMGGPPREQSRGNSQEASPRASPYEQVSRNLEPVNIFTRLGDNTVPPQHDSQYVFTSQGNSLVGQEAEAFVFNTRAMQDSVERE